MSLAIDIFHYIIALLIVGIILWLMIKIHLYFSKDNINLLEQPPNQNVNTHHLGNQRHSNQNRTKQNNKYITKFIDDNCFDKSCHYNACFTDSGFDADKSTNLTSVVERTTIKSKMTPTTKYKLMSLDNIFVPSMFNSTYCDLVFSTYYDFPDRYVLFNRINKYNRDLCKAIRIRSYYFNPNTYFELKYNGVKIRTMINWQMDIINPDEIKPEYKELVLDLLDKIKNKDMKEIFKNKYKRLSFVYKGDPSIRMTIDTNLTYIVNGQENEVNFDILEVKYPNDMDISTIYSFFSEINELANTNIEFKKFSKMEYGYFHFMKRS
jgi:hypothetical protein